MTPAEVAAFFRVDRKTPARWHKAGKIHALRTPSGHRRYFRAEAEAIRAGTPLTCAQIDALMRGQS
jgi:predicted site-specific integrase-resolvase